MGVLINEDRFGVVAATLEVASVAANTTAEQAYALKGLRPGDFVAVCKPTLHPGLGVVNARVSTADTLSLTFVNATAGAIDPAAETYLIFWFRGEKTPGAVNP